MSGGGDAWRLILGVGAAEGAAEGPINMAVDTALLEAVGAGAPPVVRFYQWSPACLSFGRNQPARGLYDTAAAARAGVTFVRRPTGGQTVLHDDELTYAVVAPVSIIGRPRQAYRRINEALVAGLRRLGVPAEVAGCGAAPPPGANLAHDWAAACFHRPEAGEVVAGGLKLVGSAQRTEARVILQHGSLLLGGSQDLADSLRAGGSAPVGGGGWTTLERQVGGRPSRDDLRDALVQGFEQVLGISLATEGLTGGEREVAGRLRSRFASARWTWRR
jgi:lipoyl(octanoyl) transferase